MTANTASKKICVLGGGGFLGSHLVEALIARTPHAVHAVDLSFAKLTLASPRLTCATASIADPGVLEQAIAGCAAVVSTTALCNPALYNTRPIEVIHANFTHLVPLVELCQRRASWLIHFSTCEVYGKETLDAAGAVLAMSEDHSPLLLGPIQRERWTYACAKQLLERLIYAAGKHGDLKFTIVRPFNVIGPRMDYLPGLDGDGVPRVLACFMRSLLCGEPLQLVDGGVNRRSFVYVDDFVDAVLRIVERPAACHGEVINIGNPANDLTIAELAQRMAATYQRLSGRDRRIELRHVAAASFYGPGYDDTRQRIPDIAKAQRLLDWSPRTSLDAMLPSIVRDYIERYGSSAP